jgi:hypothetical protein
MLIAIVRPHAVKARSLFIVLVCSTLCIGGIGCKRQSSDFALSPEAVRQIDRTNTTKISFEEKDGEIIVVVTDKQGRPHVRLLNYEDSLSKEQALGVLKQKQRASWRATND